MNETSREPICDIAIRIFNLEPKVTSPPMDSSKANLDDRLNALFGNGVVFYTLSHGYFIHHRRLNQGYQNCSIAYINKKDPIPERLVIVGTRSITDKVISDIKNKIPDYEFNERQVD